VGRGPQLGSTSTPAPPLPSIPTPATRDPRHPRPQPSTPTQRGCDGGRLYYDGCACIVLNGEVLAQGSQFSLRDVEVVTATVDLEAVRSMRSTFAARSRQAERQGPSERIPRIEARDFALGASVLPPRAKAVGGKAVGGKAAGGKAAGGAERKRGLDEAAAHGIPAPTAPTKVRIHTPEEEIGLGPACWLWDYLRRSGAGGYFLPLSGGADSSSTATIVGLMCQQVVAASPGPQPQPQPQPSRETPTRTLTRTVTLT
jgi:NAD+ synthase (glutamine-hydrolysing)